MEPRLAEYQLTTEEAIAFGRERRWEAMTPAERGLMQLRQNKLCMDFSAFHEGAEALLGRGVFTHEFAKPDLLWAEYLGLIEKPSFDDIIAKLPEHLRNKVIVLEIPESPK